MPTKWKLTLIRPKDAIQFQVRNAWSKAMKDLARWMKAEFAGILTFGGMGIQGIADTPFYKFISSAAGLSQLGIDKTQPPRLLKAYETSAFRVSSTKSTLLLRFGDVAQLKLATPHPASGTGHLQIESWLEWILDRKSVGSGFVKRASIPKGSQKNIRLAAPLGGLMLPTGVFGSTGLWRFPAVLGKYEEKWFKDNIKKIEKVILNQALMFLQNRLGKVK